MVFSLSNAVGYKLKEQLFFFTFTTDKKLQSEKHKKFCQKWDLNPRPQKWTTT